MELPELSDGPIAGADSERLMRRAFVMGRHSRKAVTVDAIFMFLGGWFYDLE